MSCKQQFLAGIAAIIFLLVANSAMAIGVFPPYYAGMQNQYWAGDEGPGTIHPVSDSDSDSGTRKIYLEGGGTEERAYEYNWEAFSDTNILKVKLWGSGQPSMEDAEVEAGLWQVYRATADSQSIGIAWHGSMYINDPPTGDDVLYQLFSSFWYDIYEYTYDDEVGDWIWSYTGIHNSYSRAINDDSPNNNSLTVDESDTINLNFGKGTIFAIDLHLETELTTNVELVSFNSNFMDTGNITSVIGAEPAAVPIPGALWLLGSGLVGLVAIRSQKA